ncbi:hypothetical protein EGY16_17980 [Burkholderia pseudomallei]|nr:hypothetical protein EGY16_17980 [Burkholderia pseudomallei]NAW72781.1 hypothetical protein [Burkholderia pseudomallei]NAX57948.1 hypothetical protein [Burkholderia pseudomallei]NAX74079.1 hypothetical protein [Burkholderia pseudomallei]NAX80337.1 hypothetical protein [Burkholderia pseudomallei]
MGKIRGASDDDLPRTGGRVAHALCRAVRRVVGFRRGVPGAGGAPMSFVKHYRRLWVGKWCRRAAWRTARRSDAAPAR